MDPGAGNNVPNLNKAYIAVHQDKTSMLYDYGLEVVDKVRTGTSGTTDVSTIYGSTSIKRVGQPG